MSDVARHDRREHCADVQERSATIQELSERDRNRDERDHPDCCSYARGQRHLLHRLVDPTAHENRTDSDEHCLPVSQVRH